MSKFNFKMPDLSKVGMWCADVLQSNSSTIVGGMSMIGLALLCRKLKIPISVISDGYYDPFPKRYNRNSESINSVIYIPSNPVEASIQAIYYGSAKTADFDSQRVSAAKEIRDIINSRKDSISEATKTYAIEYLRLISSDMDFDSGRKTVMQMISAIAKG